MLNSIFEESVPTRVKHAVRLHHLKPCGDAEVAYVLRRYGIDRSKAFARYSHALHVKYGEEDAKIELHKLNDLHSKAELKQSDSQADESDLQQTLVEMKGPRTPDDKHVKKVFQEFDIFDLGIVNHHAMPQIFHQLGYNLRTKSPAWDYTLQKVLRSYDVNEDQNTSFQELLKMVKDRRLVRYYEPAVDLLPDSLPSQCAMDLEHEEQNRNVLEILSRAII